MLGVDPARVMAAGNSSLTLMYLFVETAHLFGLGDAPALEGRRRRHRFLCPVPGYDRHFTVCESLGIEMVTVPMGERRPRHGRGRGCGRGRSQHQGHLVRTKVFEPDGRGVLRCRGRTHGRAAKESWRRLPRALGQRLRGPRSRRCAAAIADLMAAADEAGTADAMVLLGSTSKISFAGAGVAFLATGEGTLAAFAERLGTMMIGWDKVNQLRHARLFSEHGEHPRAHEAPGRSHRAEVRDRRTGATGGLGNTGFADWTRPKGGYFVSVDTIPGVASDVVALAAEAGVKLTPAGSTWPYQREPEDRNIRLAPTFPARRRRASDGSLRKQRPTRERTTLAGQTTDPGVPRDRPQRRRTSTGPHRQRGDKRTGREHRRNRRGAGAGRGRSGRPRSGSSSRRAEEADAPEAEAQADAAEEASAEPEAAAESDDAAEDDATEAATEASAEATDEEAADDSEPRAP